MRGEGLLEIKRPGTSSLGATAFILPTEALRRDETEKKGWILVEENHLRVF